MSEVWHPDARWSLSAAHPDGTADCVWETPVFSKQSSDRDDSEDV